MLAILRSGTGSPSRYAKNWSIRFRWLSSKGDGQKFYSNPRRNKDKAKTSIQNFESDKEAEQESVTFRDQLRRGKAVFSTDKPKNFLDGLGQGAGNAMMGVFGGAAILFGAPIQHAVKGAKTGGGIGALKGLAQGIGIGVVGGTAVAVGGMVSAAAQIGKGIYNTPSAMAASSQGKEWDASKQEWIAYDLRKEASEVLDKTEEQFIEELKAAGEVFYTENGDTPFESPRAQKRVHDTEYYDALGLTPSATSDEIKKAYYKKAKESHPDRHPNDPTANSRFQAVGAAYQVLSDQKLRANYDAQGKSGVEGSVQMDNAALFAMLFGSDKFEPLVGELNLASNMEDKPDMYNPKFDSFKRRRRIVRCAVNLTEKLEPFVRNGDEDKFIKEITREAKELASTPFGGTLLGTIGEVYSEYAKGVQSSTIAGLGITVSQTKRDLFTRYSIAQSGVKAAIHAKNVSGMSSSSSSSKQGRSATEEAMNIFRSGKFSGEEAERLKQEIERMSREMLSIMWHVTELDIRSTLASVCQKVVHDNSVSAEDRQRRVYALALVGKIFMDCGVAEKEGMSDIFSRMNQQ